MLLLALEKLCQASLAPDTKENAVSHELDLCMRDANEELGDNRLTPLPVFRARNQPDPAYAAEDPAEEKEPDFQWQWRDPQEPNSRTRYRHYTIECKRLQTPVLDSAREYVVSGVRRFVRPNHAYGRGLPSGAMIGYVQHGELADLLNAVNMHVRAEGHAELVLQDSGWLVHGPSRLDQGLHRPHVAPKRFQLRHFWADLR